MMQIVEEINTLRLDILDQDWVQGIYYSEFLEFGDFPPEYEGILESLEIRKVFRGVMKAIDNLLNSDESEDQKSWAALSSHIECQKLLAILAYYINHGTKNILTMEYRNNAMLACRVYYKLLSIPGFKAYHIYHSQLFAHSLACLGFPKAMCDNEDNYFNSRELTKEVNSIIKELRFFVFDLRAIVDSLQLNPSDMNFEDILSNLVDITGGAIVNKLNVDKIELANISRVIYEIIDILICDSNKEPNPVAIKLLFKCILPKLVAASMDCRNANNLVRASYVTYSGLLLSRYGKAALTGYTVLLQHLCYNSDGIERGEVRQARVLLVVGLMSLLPQKSYRKFVKWILKLSTTAKISHRHIALEMLSKLLSNEPEEEIPFPPPAEPAENSGEANTGDPLTSDNQAAKEGEATDPPAEGDNAASEPPPPAATDDESSQDSQVPGPQVDNADFELTEEEVAGLLRQRPHSAPHAAILRAVYERVNDVSSTLRARALHVLTDCLDTHRGLMREAIQEFQGSGTVSRLLAVGARGVCDERAAVRRAALTLVHRSLGAPDVPSPAPADLGILVGLCRDASVLVRSAAVAALGALAAARPAPALVDAFLAGPMHQLSDPETKVQDQVVGLIQQLLIDRIQKHAAGGGEDPLPWLFLEGVTRHNMRRHLQKACMLLAKNTSCMSHRLVDVVSTHLGAGGEGGAARDLSALVLLTAAAAHVDYSDIQFALNYYYQLADDEQGCDGRLLALTLELVSAWSRWARLAERTALRDHLVRRLATSHDDGCRLACATLAAQLDPHSLTWATELMQMSERRALESTSVREWMRAADLSLVSPAPPDPALSRLFLAALSDPPPEWDAQCVGAAVAGLGRLCLRSREVAALAAPPLAALLQRSTAPHNARVNALLALTDICTRYTCIVEPLLGCVSGCLSPGAAAGLRRAAARSLTRLLLAGYLRLRTPLYYRYCALLADADPDVREPAEYYVTSCLAADHIYHHFVDCVMHYNTEDAESLSFDARQLIYDVMLQRLSIVQKLNLQCRLAREILEHAADVTDENDEELPANLNAALLDTITVLCGPRMKLPRKPQKDGEAADMDDLHERVTTNIVSHKMKRTVAEVVVPGVLRLYARLRTRGGQIAAYLVRLATDLLADYRHEIEELIENDEELVERVRQFQETIGLEPSFGNARNLVTTSTTNEPETPRAPRKRAQRAARSPPRKRALRI